MSCSILNCLISLMRYTRYKNDELTRDEFQLAALKKVF
jgi:hypothetical protein